jgi:hypothetical protein|tara:strand:+ start:2820 stop:3080 length:261 start_codon:yes stop_codon:yes gene_type:complete
MAEAKDQRVFTIKDNESEKKYKVSDFSESQKTVFNRLEKLTLEAKELDLLLKEKNILINQYSQALVNDLQPSEEKDEQKDDKPNSK